MQIVVAQATATGFGLCVVQMSEHPDYARGDQIDMATVEALLDQGYMVVLMPLAADPLQYRQEAHTR